VIHKTAIIEKGAEIASDVEIGPYSIIGANVKIDEGTRVGPHVVINGHTTIGKNNQFYQFSSVGEVNQDKKYAGEPTQLVIGDNNIVREGVTIHRGTVQDKGITSIENDNLLMAYVHVAHDCVIGSHNILGNTAALAGHVIVGDYVNINGYCGIHQFCQIGSHAFIAHACLVTKDIPPFLMVVGGKDTTVCGINVEGLKRRGFSPEDIQWLRRAYKVIYRQGLRVADATEELDKMASECAYVGDFAAFLKTSHRGIVR